MLFLIRSSTPNKALLHSLLLLLCLFLTFGRASGASLREPRLRGSEPDVEKADTSYQAPNADMLKALEYIERLSQRTGTAPLQRTLQTPGQDTTDMEDMDRGSTRLRMASVAQSQSQTEGSEQEEGEGEEDEGKGNEEQNTQKWLQTILSAIQVNQKAPKLAPVNPRVAHSSLGKGGPPPMEEQEKEEEDDSAYQWPQRSTIASHKPRNKHQFRSEDNEDGDWEKEDKEGEAWSHESQFKRTNENVEEKYTPQNLAALQSLFEELGKLTSGNAGHKRQAEDDNDNEGYEDEDDDMFNSREEAFEDMTGIKDWLPPEEEEERRHNGLFNNGMVDDDDEEKDGEEEDEGSYQVKRSNQIGSTDEPDDITKLVDYYLLKVLEKTEEQEQKRELEEEEEEEEREERRVSESQFSDITNQQAIYKLLNIAKILQIPPEDLLDMLKEDRTSSRRNALIRGEIGRVQDKLIQTPSYKKSKSPPSKLYNRPKSDIGTEEILNMVGLTRMGGPMASPLTQQTRYKTLESRFNKPSERNRGYPLSQSRLPDQLKDDYDDMVDEDVLASYLVDKLLELYPVNKVKQRRSSQSPPQGQKEQSNWETFEQAMKDYFDQMGTDKTASQKRQLETEDMSGAPQTQTLDDEALLKMLSYLKPETEDTDDKDILNKTE